MKSKSFTILLGTILLVSLEARNLRQGQRPRKFESLSAVGVDLGFTPVNYGGQHPFEQARQRKLLNETLKPPILHADDVAERQAFQNIRIKFITDPIESQRSVHGDANTDLVLDTVLPAVAAVWSSHLSVFPADETIPLTRDDCFGLYSDQVSSDTLEAGVDNADMAIYVGANDEIGGEDICGPGTFAFALTCGIDQFDRPVLGAINFCLGNIEKRLEEDRGPNDAAVFQSKGDSILASLPDVIDRNDGTSDIILVAIHEVGHALGFGINMFMYFRDAETGEPLTPRPFQKTNVQCVDGTTQNMVFPSTDTVQAFPTSDGKFYHEVVTPRVKQVARNHFDCPTMTGARLENRPTSPTQNCTGSHWDERLFLSELMGAVFSGYTDTLSPLTLALFEDSGWYKVSYEHAELMPFGKGRGCDFVNEPCIVNDAVPDYGEDAFCADTTTFQANGDIDRTDIVCDPTHKSFALCTLVDLNRLPEDADLSMVEDEANRLFSDTNLVSVTAQADWCPIPLLDVGLDCTNNMDNEDVQIYTGEKRGLDSRCINGRVGTRKLPGCFDIVCDADQHKVIIAGRTCEFDGQELSVTTKETGQEAILVCPHLATICPNLFCPGECAGRGVCNYASTPPRCECFDETDTTSSCSKGRPVPGTLAPAESSLPTQPPGQATQPPTTTEPLPTQSPTTLSPTMEPTSDASRAKVTILLSAATLLAGLVVF